MGRRYSITQGRHPAALFVALALLLALGFVLGRAVPDRAAMPRPAATFDNRPAWADLMPRTLSTGRAYGR